MARIAGVNLPVNKRALVSLTYIHGIGPKYAMDILKANSLDPTKRIKDFSEDEISKIRKSIDESYTVEGDLRRVVSQNIKRLKDLGCYRGLRHRKQLPTRGQRTHTNARTRKGKAVAIAGKKKSNKIKWQKTKKKPLIKKNQKKTLVKTVLFISKVLLTTLL